MKIAILGTGNVGGGLAAAATKAGHDVVLSASSPASAQEAATKVGAQAAGSNAEAVESADVVVLADDLNLIADLIRHARRTFSIVRQNLGWAFAYNAIAVPAAAFGYVTPLAAAAGMSLSSLVVVGNALRLARIEQRTS